MVGGGRGGRGEEKKHESKSDVKVNPSKSVKDATVTGEGEEKETSSDVTSKAAFCDEKMTVAFPLPLHPPPSTPPSRLFLSFFFSFPSYLFQFRGRRRERGFENDNNVMNLYLMGLTVSVNQLGDWFPVARVGCARRR